MSSGTSCRDVLDGCPFCHERWFRHDTPLGRFALASGRSLRYACVEPRRVFLRGERNDPRNRSFITRTGVNPCPKTLHVPCPPRMRRVSRAPEIAIPRARRQRVALPDALSGQRPTRTRRAANRSHEIFQETPWLPPGACLARQAEEGAWKCVDRTLVSEVSPNDLATSKRRER